MDLMAAALALEGGTREKNQSAGSTRSARPRVLRRTPIVIRGQGGSRSLTKRKETRNSKSATRMTKTGTVAVGDFLLGSCGFVADFGLRISSFLGLPPQGIAEPGGG